MTWQWLWHAFRAQWPQMMYIIARTIGFAISIYITIIITRWYVRRDITKHLPEISRDQVQRAKREIEYLTRQLADSQQDVQQLRTIIRGSIATASHTVTNLTSILPVQDVEKRGLRSL